MTGVRTRRRRRPGGAALREVRIDRGAFLQLFRQPAAVIDGVAVRVATPDEQIEDAYASNPPLDCYVPYDYNFGGLDLEH